MWGASSSPRRLHESVRPIRDRLPRVSLGLSARPSAKRPIWATAEPPRRTQLSQAYPPGSSRKNDIENLQKSKDKSTHSPTRPPQTLRQRLPTRRSTIELARPKPAPHEPVSTIAQMRGAIERWHGPRLEAKPISAKALHGRCIVSRKTRGPHARTARCVPFSNGMEARAHEIGSVSEIDGTSPVRIQALRWR